MQNGNTAAEENVRVRLNEIAQRYPQAEIARRTGCPGSSVSRYLRGNRIPVSFVAAVAREFGANPAWLLFGEGAPWLADVAAPTARVGSGLVELVQTMERLTRLKLGALAGRSQARALRDLNDALEAFERVRGVLAEQSRDTYRDVLDEWSQSITAGDFERMRRLSTAADQVARLCPDPDLNRRHESNRASHEAQLGNVERALTYRRRVFLSSIPDSGDIDNEALTSAFGVVVALDALGRTGDAQRFAEAALKLAPNAHTFRSYGACLGTYGWILVQRGNLRKALGIIANAMALPMPTMLRENCAFAVAYALYLSGGVSLAGATAMVPDAARSLAPLLFVSPWCLDAAEVRALQRKYVRLRQPADLPEARIVRAHLHSLEDRHADALEEWTLAEADEAARKHNPVGLDFTLAAMRTQLLRLAGRRQDAVRALRLAEKERAAVPAHVSLDLNWQRIHWRNAHALGTALESTTRFEAFCRKRGISLA
jgi:tetratricopeptide (TPR) repeat protein